MVAGDSSAKPTSRYASARSKTLRAFRALRALRPKAALRMLPRIRTFRLMENMRVVKALRSLASTNGTKRAIARRLVHATLSAAASFSLIPLSYALAALWPEGAARASPVALRALGCAPANAISRWFGKFASSGRIPHFMHQRLIRMLIRTYGIDVSEVEKPLEEYATLQEFFSRRLRPGARLPHPKSALVSPADAEVLQVGRITDDDLLLQVKGDQYSIDQLLQSRASWSPKRKGYDRMFFLFHLRPKDYHRFHSPADITVKEAVHVPGTLHPVTYHCSKWIPGLFAKNERVSVMCEWEHGTLAFVPVGATCVGSISLGFDPRIRTNKTSSVQNFFSLFRYASGAAQSSDECFAPPSQPTTPSDTEVFAPLEPTRFDYSGKEDIPSLGEHAAPLLVQSPTLKKGEEMGWFNWGSAIVIVADVPEGAGTRVVPHQDVRVGDPLLSW